MSNWLCTDFNWPSAKTSLFPSLWHFIWSKSHTIVITLMKTDIPLKSFIFFFFFFFGLHSEVFFLYIKERNRLEDHIDLVSDMDSHMHTEWFCTWPSLAVSRFDFCSLYIFFLHLPERGYLLSSFSLYFSLLTIYHIFHTNATSNK